VQELRARKGWTQQALAEAAGLDRTYINGLERGRHNPTLGALFRLTRALGVPLDRLVIPTLETTTPVSEADRQPRRRSGRRAG